MRPNSLALAAMVILGGELATPAAAQDLSSTTAAMGAAASIGAGIGNSARGATDAARGTAPGRSYAAETEEGEGTPHGAAGAKGGKPVERDRIASIEKIQVNRQDCQACQAGGHTRYVIHFLVKCQALPEIAHRVKEIFLL